MADEFDVLAPATTAPTVSPADMSPAGPDEFDTLAPKKTGPATASTKDRALLEYASMYGQAAAQGVAEGLGGVGSLRDLIAGYVPDWVEKVAKASAPLMPFGIGNAVEAAPTVPQVTGVTNAMGLTGHEALEPKTPFEKLSAGAVRGVASAVPMLAFGAPAAATLASGAVGGEAAETAKMLAPNSAWAPVIAGAAGGIVGGGGAQYLSAIADTRQALATVNKTAAALAAAKAQITDNKLASFDAGNAAKDQLAGLTKFHNDTVEAATNASQELRDQSLAGIASQVDASKAAHDAAVAAGKASITTSEAARDAQIAAANDRVPLATSDISDGLTSLADKRGNSPDLDSAGRIVQQQARNWLTTELPKREAAAWAPVDAAIPGTTPTPIEGTLNALAAIRNKGGALSEAVAKLSPNIGAALEKPLAKFTPEGGLADLTGEAPATPTWNDVRTFRSALGEAMSNPMVLKDISRQQIERLYATVTDDLRGTAKAVSPEALDSFDLANNASKALRDFADGPISKIVTGSKPSPDDLAPGAVAKSLLNSGKTSAETLAALRADPAMAGPVDELASIHLRGVADNPKAWQALQPGAKVALVPDPADRAAVETLLGDKASLAGDTKAAVAAAKATHDANVAQAQAGIDAAKQAHLDTLAKAKELATAAHDAHTSTVSQVKSAAQDAIDNARYDAEMTARGLTRQGLEHQQKVDRLTQTLAELQAKMKPGQANGLLHSAGVSAGIGAGVAEIGAPVAEHLLGLATGVPPGLTAALGALAPTALKVAGRTLRPSSLRNAMAGANAGAADNGMGR